MDYIVSMGDNDGDEHAAAAAAAASSVAASAPPRGGAQQQLVLYRGGAVVPSGGGDHGDHDTGAVVVAHAVALRCAEQRIDTMTGQLAEYGRHVAAQQRFNMDTMQYMREQQQQQARLLEMVMQQQIQITRIIESGGAATQAPPRGGGGGGGAGDSRYAASAASAAAAAAAAADAPSAIGGTNGARADESAAAAAAAAAAGAPVESGAASNGTRKAPTTERIYTLSRLQALTNGAVTRDGDEDGGNGTVLVNVDIGPMLVYRQNATAARLGISPSTLSKRFTKSVGQQRMLDLEGEYVERRWPHRQVLGARNNIRSILANAPGVAKQRVDDLCKAIEINAQVLRDEQFVAAHRLDAATVGHIVQYTDYIARLTAPVVIKMRVYLDGDAQHHKRRRSPDASDDDDDDDDDEDSGDSDDDDSDGSGDSDTDSDEDNGNDQIEHRAGAACPHTSPAEAGRAGEHRQLPVAHANAVDSGRAVPRSPPKKMRKKGAMGAGQQIARGHASIVNFAR